MDENCGLALFLVLEIVSPSALVAVHCFTLPMPSSVTSCACTPVDKMDFSAAASALTKNVSLAAVDCNGNAPATDWFVLNIAVLPVQ